MILEFQAEILSQIRAHGESSYPEEGVGFLLGDTNRDDIRRVAAILPLKNEREGADRRNRYLVSPQDLLRGEEQAAQSGLELIGIFHSHPDHPDRPSEFDREWALPWFSYLITSVNDGQAAGSRSWRLADDRSHFIEESLRIV